MDPIDFIDFMQAQPDSAGEELIEAHCECHQTSNYDPYIGGYQSHSPDVDVARIVKVEVEYDLRSLRSAYNQLFRHSVPFCNAQRHLEPARCL